ncbi:glycine-rich domain-containing protein [Pantoea agglomerans]|uniref:glycine-rich domain-containing protein n=1 Tax=Enterobacter agglomerans TaxID=549 RepID=UPI003C7BCE9D
MHRIDTSTAQVDKFGAGKNGFTGGNPQTGELPTALDADFFDSVQEEIAAVIEAAGITLAKVNNAQLLTAMKSLVGPGRLLNVQSFPASATYIPVSGTKRIRIRAWGAGGSGSGTATSGTGAAGGAGGAYVEVTIDLGTLTSIPITVGKGGAGIAANSSAAGNAGGDTLIPLLGITAKGGGGGGSGAGGTPTSSKAIASLLVKGQDGQGSAITGIGGQGGAAFASSAGVARTGSSSDAGGYPGGASAGGSYPSGGTPRGSGSGADGLVIIEEYA